MPTLLAVDVAQERILKEYIAGKTVYELVLNGEANSRYAEMLLRGTN